MNFLIEIAAFVVAIGVLVVVHEFGHYSVARLCGVKVLRFSVGFGKPLLKWVSKSTGTESNSIRVGLCLFGVPCQRINRPVYGVIGVFGPQSNLRKPMCRILRRVLRPILRLLT